MTVRSSPDDRLLVLTPRGRDARLTAAMLDRGGIACVTCRDMDEVVSLLEEGAAGLLLAEEALTSPAAAARLVGALAAQPSWSDMPIVLFSSSDAGKRRAELIAALGNVTLLERPLRPLTMLSAARAALRARRRQYETRAVMREQALAVAQRDQFLAMLGHELRNPLGAIQMASELMTDADGPVQAREVIRRQTRHLTRLVDDLLDVARVISDKVTLATETIDLCAMVPGCIATVAAGIAANELDVTVDMPSVPVVVLGDPVRLEQVIVNILTNSIKYTPRSGHVAITLSAAGDRAVIEVADDGIGIAPEMVDKIFDLFTQVDSSLDRSMGGLGVGLTLARNLVQLHGGRLSVRSAGLGRGSVFAIDLPRLDESSRAVEDDSAPAPAPLPGVSRRILIIEDNRDSRELLETMLREDGHTVTSAADGLAGVVAALDTRPEVLLVDLGLPILDGFGVAREIRRALATGVYLIAVTGYGRPEDRHSALAAGFDLHIAKPLDPAELRAMLSHPTLPPTERALDPAAD